MNVRHIALEALALSAEELSEAGEGDPTIALAAETLPFRAVLAKWVAPIVAAPVVATTMVAAKPKLEELRETSLAIEFWSTLRRPTGAAATELKAEEFAHPDLMESAVGVAAALIAATASLLSAHHCLEVAAWDTPAMLEQEPQGAHARPACLALEVGLACEATSGQSVHHLELLDAFEVGVIVDECSVLTGE